MSLRIFFPVLFVRALTNIPFLWAICSSVFTGSLFLHCPMLLSSKELRAMHAIFHFSPSFGNPNEMSKALTSLSTWIQLIGWKGQLETRPSGLVKSLVGVRLYNFFLRAMPLELYFFGSNCRGASTSSETNAAGYFMFKSFHIYR